MREIAIDSSINSKIVKGKKSFYNKELPKDFPSLSPGEWINLKGAGANWSAYGNPFADKEVPCLWIVGEGISKPEVIQEANIKKAFQRREQIYLNEGKRLVYGQSDDLPGLIIDEYKNHILIQINTAGMDLYRNNISTYVNELRPDKKVILFDRDTYRSSESLPQHPKSWINDEVIEAIDSGFEYSLTLGKIQKLGFYFDHRDNRQKFERYVASQFKNDWSALDLFCYQGAWGLHAARAGAKKIDLIDQANLEDDIKKNFERAKIKNDMNFVRSDVFKYLDGAIVENKKWDAIICDPPAFCKSIKQKNQALSGYQKLYNKSLQLVSTNGVLVAASCTKYVSLDELMKIVEDQAAQLGRRIWLKDIGVQGKDHPFTSFRDKACYIKYILYAVD